MGKKIFNYSELKKDKNFPAKINIVSIDNGKIFYEIILKKDNKFYKVEDVILDIDRYNDFDYYFNVVKGGKVSAYEVKKIKTISYKWEMPKEYDFEKEMENIKKELSQLSLIELGSIINIFGKKHKGKTVQEVYDKDVDFIKWLKENPPKYNQLNEYSIRKEKSRLALIYYYDAKLFLKNQGK